MWGEPRISDRKGNIISDFNSLAPCGANLDRFLVPAEHNGISTHSPRVGRTGILTFFARKGSISTHSPRVGRTKAAATIKNANDISTHSPRVGRTLRMSFALQRLLISTHSPRVGRTSLARKSLKDPDDFNSLAPCGANRTVYGSPMQNSRFQLTRPVWGEPIEVERDVDGNEFQLTRPVWGEPKQ